MEDLLSGALLLLLVGGAVFAWFDWRMRARKLPQLIGPSWDCPHCGVKNEAELSVMSCMEQYIPTVLLVVRKHAGQAAETAHLMIQKTPWYRPPSICAITPVI